MEFWTWLVASGIISGDPKYYSSGKATSAEYTHAIRTAVNSLYTPFARQEFFRRLRETGAYVGDWNYYASGQATASEIDNLVKVSSGALRDAAYTANPVSSPANPAPAPAPAPRPTPPPTPQPAVPQPPPPPPAPTPTPIDYRARAAALYPFLPPSLLDIFAEKWAESGDPELALAETRMDSRYDSYFPGIKRDDGSLRMSEAEYLGRIDGYHMALGQFGLNSTVFSNHFVEMIEGNLTPSELSQRLGAAYDQVVTAMPQVREFYATNYGVELTDEAIFASFIDPEVGNAILNNRIAVSQIGGAGAAFGFQLDVAFAERIRQRGVGFDQAQQVFAEAAYQIPILSTLAQRFDTDQTFDIGEFASASIFSDPAQIRRIKRIRGAEASSFTENLGGVATGQDFAVTGLSAR